MNPARDLGPRLVTAVTGWGTLALSPGWWAFTIGPCIGAVLGGAAYGALTEKNYTPPDVMAILGVEGDQGAAGGAASA